MEATQKKLKALGLNQIYLFIFDPTLPEYYTRLGWKTIGIDVFWTHPVTVRETKL